MASGFEIQTELRKGWLFRAGYQSQRCGRCRCWRSWASLHRISDADSQTLTQYPESRSDLIWNVDVLMPAAENGPGSLIIGNPSRSPSTSPLLSLSLSRNAFRPISCQAVPEPAPEPATSAVSPCSKHSECFSGPSLVNRRSWSE